MAQLLYNSNPKNEIQLFMDLQNEEVKVFLQSLNSNAVQYMLVGGMAGIVHGHIRTTIDCWICGSRILRKTKKS